MMLLTGLNFLPESKVVFVEKAQGRVQSILVRMCSQHFQVATSCSSPLVLSQNFFLSKQSKTCQQATCGVHQATIFFNQSVFTFAEVSIACSLVLATRKGMNHNHHMCNISFSHFPSLPGCPVFSYWPVLITFSITDFQSFLQ